MKEIKVGQEISGTFSKLAFSGTVVRTGGYLGECVVVLVKNPHRNLPAPKGELCFHPSSKNVVLN